MKLHGGHAIATTCWCPGFWRNPLAPCIPSGYPTCCRLCEGLLHRVQLISSVSQAPITVHRNEGIVLPATQRRWDVHELTSAQFFHLMNSCPDSHLLPLCPVACMFRMVSAKRKTAKLHNGVLRLEQVITFVKG